jgi:hypothetical protein
MTANALAPTAAKLRVVNAVSATGKQLADKQSLKIIRPKNGIILLNW